MKKLFYLAICFFLVLSLNSNLAHSVLSCSYKPSGCTAGETSLVSIASDSGFTNPSQGSHVGGPTDYASRICCTASAPLSPYEKSGSACNVAEHTKVLNLHECNGADCAGEDNSHAAIPEYSSPALEGVICTSILDAQLSCRSTTDACDSSETRLLAFSQNNDSHVFQSSGAITLCCKEGAPIAISGNATQVIFGASEYKVPLGEIVLAKVNVRITENVPTDYVLQISGTPNELRNWIWFDGHRFDSSRIELTSSFGPREQKTFFIAIFGGKQGNYDLSMTATSQLNGRSFTGNTVVKIEPFTGTAFTPTPEPMFLMPLLLLFALIIVRHINKQLPIF